MSHLLILQRGPGYVEDGTPAMAQEPSSKAVIKYNINLLDIAT